MPRAFNEHERQEIKNKLQKTAEYFLLHQSMSKISIDDLVKEANIAKGTFYSFYENKELLFYDVFRIRHDAIQDEFLRQVKRVGPDINAKKLTNIIFDLFKTLDETFILKMASRGDLERLMRKIPESLIADHMERDQLSMQQLFTALPQVAHQNVHVFSGAFRLALVSIMHKKDIGEDVFEDALYLVIYGIILQMMKEKS